jgi:hypothetical protein
MKTFEAVLDMFGENVSLFLFNAESRYVLFLKLVAQHQDLIPPWDVAIVMHSHMLNPSRYRNDIRQMFPHNENMWNYSCPLLKLKELSLDHSIDRQSEVIWNEFYPKSPYLLVDPVNPNSIVLYNCPYCMKLCNSTAENLEKLSTEKSTFSIQCSECSIEHSANSISAKRFLNDCASLMQDSNLTLSGMHFPRKEYESTIESIHISNHLFQGKDDSFREYVRVMSSCPQIPCHWKTIFTTFQDSELQMRSFRVRRYFLLFIRSIVSEYRGFVHPFSLSLVAAVLRQRSFSVKITNIQMDKVQLQQARIRYERWFSLLSNQNHMLVPTLDIDLVWHTHQLFPSDYLNWCFRQANRFIDHDDNVETSKLDSSLERTALAWYGKFKEPYMVDENHLIDNFWTSARIIKSILFPPYMIYAISKKRKLSKSCWSNEKIVPIQNRKPLKFVKTKRHLHRSEDFEYVPLFSACGTNVCGGCVSSNCSSGLLAYHTGTVCYLDENFANDSYFGVEQGSSNTGGCGTSGCGTSGCGTSGCGSS